MAEFDKYKIGAYISEGLEAGLQGAKEHRALVQDREWKNQASVFAKEAGQVEKQFSDKRMENIGEQQKVTNEMFSATDLSPEQRKDLDNRLEILRTDLKVMRFEQQNRIMQYTLQAGQNPYIQAMVKDYGDRAVNSIQKRQDTEKRHSARRASAHKQEALEAKDRATQGLATAKEGIVPEEATGGPTFTEEGAPIRAPGYKEEKQREEQLAVEKSGRRVIGKEPLTEKEQAPGAAQEAMSDAFKKLVSSQSTLWKQLLDESGFFHTAAGLIVDTQGNQPSDEAFQDVRKKFRERLRIQYRNSPIRQEEAIRITELVKEEYGPAWNTLTKAERKELVEEAILAQGMGF